MDQRLKRLRAFIKENQLDGIIINKPENRRYFSGFTGSAGILVISDKDNRLLTDFRYVEQATQQAPLYQIIRYDAAPNSLYEVLGTAAKSLGLHKVGFESDFVTYDSYRTLSTALPGLELMPVKLDSLRMVKDKGELTLLKQAVEIADNAFSHILSFLKPGIKEYDVAVELEYKMRQLGAEKAAFDIIVASGKRGALPHGQASDKKIEPGDFVTMDFGAVYHGYHSDITRTVVIGKASAKQREIYQIVLGAQLAGVRAVKAGELCCDVDAAARKVIEDAGYREYFGHGLGHGVGLAIHEDPRLSPANTTVKLADNMTVTVEPGIYLPDWGGLRIEDTVVVINDGADILTASDKQLIEL